MNHSYGMGCRGGGGGWKGKGERERGKGTVFLIYLDDQKWKGERGME
jgi:hypothetical protein